MFVYVYGCKNMALKQSSWLWAAVCAFQLYHMHNTRNLFNPLYSGIVSCFFFLSTSLLSCCFRTISFSPPLIQFTNKIGQLKDFIPNYIVDLHRSWRKTQKHILQQWKYENNLRFDLNKFAACIAQHFV